ncbi:YbaB/EbfC family nucleoid-associated protein [Actinoplanes sp. NPDC020271]|uniref:YbaB/EbfC family nucleoid-associated protein n=1 Tax=Actinoplanes sp. NPDC020271 TaxID=3363896 RepID=UPI0037BD2062
MGDHPNFSHFSPDPSGFVSADAAAGRVWVELDGSGRLTDLYLDPRVTQMPVEDLRAALIAAFTTAQDRAAEQAPSWHGAPVAPERLTRALAEASDTAERRFAEVATALNDLNRRAARPW